MKKILVPTDFSNSSKSGVRFAIHWATQQKIELVFIHVLHVLRPTRWSDTHFAKVSEMEEKESRIKFEKFIAGIYKTMKVSPGKHSFIIVHGISPDISIVEYCKKNPGIDYICISTRGAGKFNKIFGTNTGNLITKSQVPVLAVPDAYKISTVKNVLYASDLQKYSEEIKKVIDFASPLKAAIEVLHISWPHEIVFDEKSLASALKKNYKYGLQIRFEKNDAVQSVIENLQTQIKKSRPSVVIMFTNQQRTLFSKIFNASKAEALSFDTKVPLLIFNKNLN